MSKRRAFEPLEAVLGLRFEEEKKEKNVYSLIDFQATLQPTKSFLHPSNLFISNFFLEINYKVCQKGGLLSHWRHFQAKNVKSYNYFKIKCNFFFFLGGAGQQIAISPFVDASRKKISVLLFASVKRFGPSRIQDFKKCIIFNGVLTLFFTCLGA